MKKFSAILLALVLMLSMTAMAASITINPPENSDTGTETGIIYTAYKIFDATITKDADGKVEKAAYSIESDSPYFATVQQSSYFTLTKIAGSETTYLVVKNDTYTEDAANTFADTLKAVQNATPVGSQNGNVITVPSDGYYLVTSSVGTDLILETIGDITVDTKNEYPTIGKTVNDDSAHMGEILTFTITVDIPEDATGEIVVHDKMTGLEYVSMTAVTGITETKAPTTTNEAGETVDEGCTVHFTLTSDYVAANKGKTVTITYTAKVTADIANNEAWLVDDSFTSKPTTPINIYSVDVVIDKVDGTTSAKLSGAKFVLKAVDVENTAINGKFYKVDDEGNVTWVENQADATVVTTDTTGAASFENVEAGSYELIETEAPAGYNLMTAAKPVTVTAAVENNAVVDVDVIVENNTGSEMPSTGGIGTTIFYVVGGVLMAAAIVLLVSKRKVAASK